MTYEEIIASPFSSDEQKAQAQKMLDLSKPKPAESGKSEMKPIAELLAGMMTYEPTPEEWAANQERQRLEQDRSAKRASAEISHALNVLRGGAGYKK